MKIPTIDLTGRVTFPPDSIQQEGEHVGDNGNTADHHDPDPDLVREAEQTADLAENDRQRAEKLWNDGWQSGHRAGYRDAVEDRKD